MGVLAWIFIAPVSTAAATIVGTVRAHGPGAPGGGEGSDDAYGSRRYKFIEKIDYAELSGFIVWIDQPVPENELPATRPAARIGQPDRAFTPRVLPVPLATTVGWPNQDTI